MCINMSGLPMWILSPTHLVQQGARALGVSKGAASLLTGFDPVGTAISQKQWRDEDKADKKEKANADAWKRYYASRNAVVNSSPILGNPQGTKNSLFTGGA